jgi:hypothetical protein
MVRRVGTVWSNCVRVYLARLAQGRGMSERQVSGALTAAALLLAALALGGCSTSISEMSIGSAASDTRPKEAGGAYMPVNETPPAREESAMDPAERAKVQKELIAARERQALANAAKDQSKDQQNQK